MNQQYKVNDRVRISCDKDTDNPDIRHLREKRCVGVVVAAQGDPYPTYYHVAFNGDDPKQTFMFKPDELVLEADADPCAEQIPVMRWSMEGLPDLFVKSTDGLDAALEDTFLGAMGEWKDWAELSGGFTLHCTFEMMNRVEFESLEAWEA